MELVDRLGRSLDIVRTVLDMVGRGKTGAEAVLDVRERMLALKEELLALKDQVFALQQENLELRQKLQKTQQFEAERERYALRETYPNSFAYVIEQPRDPVEEKLHFCPYCFERGERSILQLEERENYYDLLTCHACGTKVRVPNDIRPTFGSTSRGLFG